MAQPATAVPSAISAAQGQIGVPYQWGGQQPGVGFDCSGLLQWAFEKQGVQIPRTTYQQYQTGTPVPESQLQPGDAVFFTGSDPKNGLPGHVGLYIGNGQVIQAPQTGQKVQVSSLADLSKEAGYVGARRYAPPQTGVAAATSTVPQLGKPAVPQKVGLKQNPANVAPVAATLMDTASTLLGTRLPGAPRVRPQAPPPVIPAATNGHAALATVLAKYPTLDPQAVLAVASQEGLGGGIGDNGTSFGDFQLHQGGAYPSFAPQNPQAAQAWANSPQGLNYALGKIATVAGGLKGPAAVKAIVTNFERPANPGGEIAGALGAYGKVAAPRATLSAAPAQVSPVAQSLAAPHPGAPLLRLAQSLLK